MEENKLSDNVIEQIKDFPVDHYGRPSLTEEQESIIDKLILDEKLIERYKKYGPCKECKQPNTDGSDGTSWCQTCNGKRFQENYGKWSSGNQEVDELILRTQLNAKRYHEVIEWIEYDRFENIEYLTKEGFGTTYKATWKDGYIWYWDSENNLWKRIGYKHVALKCLHDPQEITKEFLKKLLGESFSYKKFRCYGITKDPETNNFIIVINDIFKDFDSNELTEEHESLIDKLILDEELRECFERYGLCKGCKQPKTYCGWCQTCNGKRFQENFGKWSSGNQEVDELIQKTQLKARKDQEVIEWIEYDRFENIEYLVKGGFGITYKATWKDGHIENWDFKNNQWSRIWDKNYRMVALKCLHDPQEITKEFLKKVELFIANQNYSFQCYGITKDPETNKFMIVINNIFKDFNSNELTEEQESLIDKLILDKELRERYEKYGLCKECKQLNTGIFKDNKCDNYWCQICNGKRFQENYGKWSSGNQEVDELILRTQLKAKSCQEVTEWIEYDRFENVKYLAKGGFGITYKATWKDGFIKGWNYKNNQWKRETYMNFKRVALKCLHNSQDIMAEFLREVGLHIMVNDLETVVPCYGITKNPETNNFMIVMVYAENGSLRQYLNNKVTLLNWNQKLSYLHNIAKGLTAIHNKDLIHRDFHCGNILSWNYNVTFITDLGLCRPANEKKEEKQIYGVLPYVAPEVLRGKEYTQASDIYGFGIIAYELCTGYPPYYDIEHDENLAIRICNGQRPKSNYKIPQLILDIINQCWDADLLKRPKAKELENLFNKLHDNFCNKENSEIYEQVKEANKINKNLSKVTSHSGTLSYITHLQAIYTSRLLNFKNLPEPKNANGRIEYSESIEPVDFGKLNIKDRDFNYI